MDIKLQFDRQGENNTPCCKGDFWFYIFISFALLLFAGLTSGLSLGLLSHSKVDLEVLIKSGLPKYQKNAAKILPLVQNECFLLCTLLIAKSLATEALPIFLDRIIPFWGAIAASVIFVVAFVEVIPQVLCSKHGLSFGARFTLFVRLLVFILSPVAYPTSKLLDWILGENRSAIFRRSELKTLVDLHSVKAGKGGDLTDDETTIISGALGLTEKIAKDAMTPLSKAFSLDINSKLDKHTMKMIASKGHSRIPIYADNPANIIGLILVKNLIFYHPEDETPIKSLTIRRILRVYDNWTLFEVLQLFQEGHVHMAVVVKSDTYSKETSQRATDHSDLKTIVTIPSDSQPTETNAKGRNQSHPMDNIMRQSNISPILHRQEPGNGNVSHEELETLWNRFIDEEVIGIITMEDVLEELLQEDIVDETDRHVEIYDEIRVNFRHSRSPSSSSGRLSVSQQKWRTPRTSFSSSNLTPTIQSPLHPYFSSPFLRRMLFDSSVNPTITGSRSLGTIRSSLSFNQIDSSPRQISRRSNEAFWTIMQRME